MVDELAVRTVGQDGPHVMFLHGLFGQGRNFTTLAKRLAEGGRQVSMVDLPNHGHSPWSAGHSYPQMAEQVTALLAKQPEPVVLVGHSMGGKVAMTVALSRPELVRALVVVDIAPVSYPPGRVGSPFAEYVQAMRSIDLSALHERSEADAVLQPVVPDAGVRAFLLQSLVRDPSADPPWRWRLNLPVLAEHLGELTQFPDPVPGAHYDGPVLWIAGASSGYVSPADRPAMDAWFPQTRLVRIKGAGHWVHSEQPSVFLDVLSHFLDELTAV